MRRTTMKYIGPTMNLLTPAASAIRGEGNGFFCIEKMSANSSDGNTICGFLRTSTSGAYEVDE
jgi:hypothetical protein